MVGTWNSLLSFPPSTAKVHPQDNKTNAVMKITACIWLVVILTAMVMIANFTSTPGLAREAPAQWPAQSKISLDNSRPTLIMFAHPHCPCTQASVGELEELMAYCQGRINAHVVFIEPSGTAKDWVETDLWRRASAIPGVQIHEDAMCVEASLFKAETSGFTVLYDTKGTLQFAGGITIARGHMGDNPGLSTIEKTVTQGLPHYAKTPVFGCSLFGTECRPEDAR